jgi:hypothetical protein
MYCFIIDMDLFGRKFLFGFNTCSFWDAIETESEGSDKEKVGARQTDRQKKGRYRKFQKKKSLIKSFADQVHCLLKNTLNVWRIFIWLKHFQMCVQGTSTKTYTYTYYTICKERAYYKIDLQPCKNTPDLTNYLTFSKIE